MGHEYTFDKIHLYNGDEDDINEKWQELFGSEFPKNEVCAESAYERAARKTEQFMYQLFSIDIRYNLKIDCEVTQKGYRTFQLRYMLIKGMLLLVDKSLKFEIQSCDVPGGVESCDI